MRIQFTVTDEELKILTKKSIEGNYPSISEYCKCISLQENTSYVTLYNTLLNKISSLQNRCRRQHTDKYADCFLHEYFLVVLF